MDAIAALDFTFSAILIIRGCIIFQTDGNPGLKQHWLSICILRIPVTRKGVIPPRMGIILIPVAVSGITVKQTTKHSISLKMLNICHLLCDPNKFCVFTLYCHMTLHELCICQCKRRSLRLSTDGYSYLPSSVLFSYTPPPPPDKWRRHSWTQFRKIHIPTHLNRHMYFSH